MDSLLLLGLGLPAILALLFGIMFVAGTLPPYEDTVALVAALAVFGGGLAGMWGTETLRRSPGRGTRWATIAAAAGPVALVALIILDVVGVTPFAITPWG